MQLYREVRKKIKTFLLTSYFKNKPGRMDQSLRGRKAAPDWLTRVKFRALATSPSPRPPSSETGF